MYTLWMEVSVDRSFREHYVTNLSTDYTKAVEKATARAKAAGCELIIDAPEDLKDIVRGTDVIRFGKYKDQHVSKLTDEKYLSWLWRGGPIEKMNSRGEKYPEMMTPKGTPIQMAAEQVLLETGYLVVHNDRVITKKRRDEIVIMAAKNAQSIHIGEVGQKLTAEVVVERISGFDGMYGHTNIYAMRDPQDNVIIFKSGTYLYLPVTVTDLITGEAVSEKELKDGCYIGVEKGRYHTFHNACGRAKADEMRDLLRTIDFQGQDANWISSKTKRFYHLEYSEQRMLQVGDRVKITGTVKEHNEYRETKQTILQRAHTVL